MMGKKDNAERTQMEIASLKDLVPRNHLVRKLDEAIDMSFIYEEVKDLYSDFGRESIDPVVLIKIAMIQYITMNSLTAIYARITKCFITPQQTVKDIGSIKVTGLFAKTVLTGIVAQTVKIP